MRPASLRESPASDRQAFAEDNPGAVLREIRRANGWTLADVSQRTGMPVSTLSKAETGKMSLSYEKLLRISRGLEIDITRLFSTAAPAPVSRSAVTGRRSITPSGEGPSIRTATYNYVYPSADLLHKTLNPMIIDIQVRSIADFGDLMRHPGEEYALVLEGQCEFYCDLYAPSLLKTGDSIYFDGTMGHGYVAVGEGPCRILSICSANDADLKSALTPIDGRDVSNL
ncbi:XRE family transcriptional regulator [Sphingomonas sp. QA11]|uniref:helix-turn-helix domain-containing protein n=1 Tax=Sphingomonas sp. QA11 TaxID=2950605 RepID=UPI00234BAC7C|nr:XRE family transcriptional regulator [Sphingomonas sp. QA11]WCM28442.1 XRE family transcriptional regulator [Sphingomonas sp. QA11]